MSGITLREAGDEMEISDSETAAPARDAESYAAMEELFTALMASYRALRRHFSFPEAGLTRTQATILNMLGRRGSARISELNPEVGLDQSVVSRQVRALEKREFVRRAKDPRDGRASVIELTTKGRETLNQIWESRYALLDGALREAPIAALGETTKILEKITKAWSQAEE
ncbi:MAG: MarR family transcriptional regulator [Propionibacteriaceae bacterium]|jgi:DNA-binding MarR family transcriptional regulator|nr:MarR family transcriptional regulator [Propionibacteriaceae bacterium]